MDEYELRSLRAMEWQLLIDATRNRLKLIELIDEIHRLHAIDLNHLDQYLDAQPPDAHWCPDPLRCKLLQDQIAARTDRHVWDDTAVRPGEWF
jgi:hypothetical protein